jgi:DNA-binding beta-propeller fold protein YncE
VYVTDEGNNHIQKFDSTGNFIIKWGSKGSADGQSNPLDKLITGVEKLWGFTDEGNGKLDHSSGIAVDLSGNVYVADSGNNRIQKFDSNGHFITSWGKTGSENGNFSVPYGIAVDSGYVYVADNSNNRIQKFDSNGHFITSWGNFGWIDGSFNHPEDIAIDPKTQYVYVTEKTNNRVQVFFPYTFMAR